MKLLTVNRDMCLTHAGHLDKCRQRQQFSSEFVLECNTIFSKKMYSNRRLQNGNSWYVLVANRWTLAISCAFGNPHRIQLSPPCPFPPDIGGYPPRSDSSNNGPLARYEKLRVAHAPGMPGTFFPPPRVGDPDMHHGTCVKHVPWCMPGSLTRGLFEIDGGENAPGIPPAHAQPAILRIW